ncbi:hypothetical protein Hanom_Chr00s074702g01790561 [Helianthus anomalus]
MYLANFCTLSLIVLDFVQRVGFGLVECDVLQDFFFFRMYGVADGFGLGNGFNVHHNLV